MSETNPTLPILPILIVEDNADIRDLVISCLVARGYQAIGVGSAEHAVRLLHSSAVDLILLDIMLEGTSGLELVEQLRPVTDAPIIAMSASDLLLAESHLWREFADFLPKPFGLNELVECVERNLSAAQSS